MVMQLIYDSGYPVYAIVRRKSDGYVYNHITALFEIWVNAKLIAEEYDYTLMDEGGDLYTWIFPVLTGADYTVVYYLLAGAVPAVSDFVIDDRNVVYSGSAIVDPEAAPAGSYISTETGDNLALLRLNTTAWDEASIVNKQKAIKMATDAIDMLNFIGEKTEDDQELEFPRGGDTEIPVYIQRATFEIALALLDGADPELDFASLNLVSSGIANVRSTYNRASNPAHIIAGIPSATAWKYLRPFLRDSRAITMSRV